MDQGRRLERLPGLFVRQSLGGEAAQFFIDKRQELFGFLRVAALHGRQDFGHVVHREWPLARATPDAVRFDPGASRSQRQRPARTPDRRMPVESILAAGIIPRKRAPSFVRFECPLEVPNRKSRAGKRGFEARAAGLLRPWIDSRFTDSLVDHIETDLRRAKELQPEADTE